MKANWTSLNSYDLDLFADFVRCSAAAGDTPPNFRSLLDAVGLEGLKEVDDDEGQSDFDQLVEFLESLDDFGRRFVKG